eukprot:TRINITY_DN7191_c0_g1_i1.p1 TRINITY_DN7191_c0_g1~~TRINITY_DN7191_c0_g1_i1.p1  ORF type:complete len:290 (+),score=128.07 TRINITY_DN7191_c0_g1_i1:106-870(+)
MANAESFGMMDGAYFVSRTELLEWLNSTLGLNYSKVEQCCSGLAHLQLLDAMYPGKVQLHKANFEAKLEHEYISNFKVLQAAFGGVGIKKVVEIERLVKGKYQDNLEFLQWMKRFADAKMPKGPVNYDPVEARETVIASHRRQKQSRIKPKQPPPAKQPAAGGGAGQAAMPTSPSVTAAASPSREPSEKVADRDKLKLICDTLEAERDFYYAKLRQIEMLCADDDDSATVTKAAIRTILYAVSDNFEPPRASPS